MEQVERKHEQSREELKENFGEFIDMMDSDIVKLSRRKEVIKHVAISLCLSAVIFIKFGLVIPLTLLIVSFSVYLWFRKTRMDLNMLSMVRDSTYSEMMEI